MCATKREIKFKYYKNCFGKKIKISRLKRKVHNVFRKKDSKIALISNDEKSLRTFDGTVSYPYDIESGGVCKTELQKYRKMKSIKMINFDNVTGENK